MNTRTLRLALASAALALAAVPVAQAAPAPLPADLPADVRAKIEARIAEFSKQPPGQPQSTLGPAIASSQIGGENRLELMAVQESRSKSATPPNLPPGMAAPGSGQLLLGIAVSGPKVGLTSRLRNTTITRMVDDRDRDVLPLPTAAGRGGAAATSPISLMFTPPTAAALAAGNFLRATVNAQLPQRDALRLKVIEGEMEVYSPSAAPGAVVTIKNAAASAGKPVEDPTLAKHGIEVMVITRETYPEAKAMLPPGGDPTFMNSLVLYLKDPNSLLAGWSLQDAGGNGVPYNGLSSRGQSIATGWMREIRSNAGMPANVQVVLYLATPEAVLKIPFRFENIALP